MAGRTAGVYAWGTMKKTMNLKDPPLLHQAQELKEFSSTEDPGLRAGMELYLVFRGKSEVL